jgi:ribosomal protein L15
VKLLANGEAPRGLVVCVDRASAAARAKVEAAGGKVEIAS